LDADPIDSSKDARALSHEGAEGTEGEGEGQDIVIKRQTLKDLFHLIQRLNQNKSEGSVLERQLSEITLSLKKQTEDERERSRGGQSDRDRDRPKDREA
jgi:hypothetical protein